jgi:hypothetical protein
MSIKSISILLIITSLAWSCKDNWDEHYSADMDSVNRKMWETILQEPEFSSFVEFVSLFELDTIMISENTKTLFIPTNDAFTEIISQGDTINFRETLKYHLTTTYFMIRNVKDKYRLKTLSEKFALIENINNEFFIDGVKIIDSSPMFLDGKYYVIEDVVNPIPNLYQYLQTNNPAIKSYIDTQDSLVLDLELSKPLGLDDDGRTIYDSVVYRYNFYEEEYFPISQEFMNISATLILPDQVTYENALDDMANQLGSQYNTFKDIPEKWQNEVIIPELLSKGTYGGMLEPNDIRFGDKVANIIGDSIIVDYEIDPGTRAVCSNGLLYNYSSFQIADIYYLNNVQEAESMAKNVGIGKYVWDPEEVIVGGNTSFQPFKQEVNGASNDSTVSVPFITNFDGSYSITFSIKHVFPGDYRFVWRTNYRNTGIYSLYINDEILDLGLMGEKEFDTYNLLGGFFSVQGYKIYPDDRGYCDVDGLVAIEEYGNVKIKIEYKGSGAGSSNGLNIDYVALIRD